MIWKDAEEDEIREWEGGGGEGEKWRRWKKKCSSKREKREGQRKWETKMGIRKTVEVKT